MSKSPEDQNKIKAKGSKDSLLLLKQPSQPVIVPRTHVQKPTKVQDKYYLKSLHAEIDLYDRKLAHMAKYERFASEAERETAVTKMTTKRATLARIAEKLAQDGIEFHPSDLPRSFRTQTDSAGHATLT